MVSDLAALRFDQLGNPVLRWDAIPPVYAPAGRPHRLLVVLAEFADRKFVRFQGDATQGRGWRPGIQTSSSIRSTRSATHSATSTRCRASTPTTCKARCWRR
ncbi:MAG: hypothetical protein R3F43_19475 [bacterium]